MFKISLIPKSTTLSSLINSLSRVTYSRRLISSKQSQATTLVQSLIYIRIDVLSKNSVSVYSKTVVAEQALARLTTTPTHSTSLSAIYLIYAIRKRSRSNQQRYRILPSRTLKRSLLTSIINLGLFYRQPFLYSFRIELLTFRNPESAKLSIPTILTI